MSGTKIVRCGYKHCQHESRELLRDSAVNVKGKYFHSDCLLIRDNINEIKQLYRENIDKNVSIPQLLGAINNIIFKKNVNSQYLLFGIEYWINKKVKIKSPYTLYYIQNNKVIMKAWQKELKGNKLGGE